MDLHLVLQSHHWERRAPDWLAAAVAGFAAGALVMVIEMLWAVAVQGTSPWLLPRMIAAIAMGPGALQGSEFSVQVIGVALAIHYALGTAMGMLLAAIVAPFRLDSSLGLVLAMGALFGLVVYLIDFYVMVQAFSWFKDVRGLGMLMLHVIFGIAAAAMYRRFGTAVREPRAAAAG
jgi:hypothetical protein